MKLFLIKSYIRILLSYFFIRMQNKLVLLFEKIGLAGETSSLLNSVYFHCLF